MEILAHYQSPPSPCGYLPDRDWSLEYELVLSLNHAEYMERMAAGWRRFGHMLFKPNCPGCQACQSLRVPIESFSPNRSQRRAAARNDKEIELRIGAPDASRDKLDLYDRYHRFQADVKDWPVHYPKDVASYLESFVNNPFTTEEWRYFLNGKLIGIGYVDPLPKGLSAIYFFYDPEMKQRSLGTWNVLRILEEARRRRLPHVYLGYYVADCPSLAYKAHFTPNEILRPDGTWVTYRT